MTHRRRSPCCVDEAARYLAAATSERQEDELLSAAWEALRQTIWENAPSYDPAEFIADHRPVIEAAVRSAVERKRAYRARAKAL